MQDPYQVLGVSPSSTEDQITQAYRKLAKKYHPDLNPGNEVAERKMREVNAAYEQIRTQKHGGATYERPTGGGAYGNPNAGSYGNGQYSGNDQYNPFGDGPFASGSGFDPFEFFNMFGGGQQEQQYQRQQQRPTSPKMQAVYNFIQHRQYQEALRVLSDITERSAEWYYFSALANSGTGNRVTALNHAREATRREPDNDNYQQLLEQFEQGSFQYQQAGQGFGFDMSRGGGIVKQLCITYMLCNCFCRPCCRMG